MKRLGLSPRTRRSRTTATVTLLWRVLVNHPGQARPQPPRPAPVPARKTPLLFTWHARTPSDPIRLPTLEVPPCRSLFPTQPRLTALCARL